MPLLLRKTAWTVLVDAQSAQPVGFVALDSFEGPNCLQPPLGVRNKLSSLKITG